MPDTSEIEKYIGQRIYLNCGVKITGTLYRVERREKLIVYLEDTGNGRWDRRPYALPKENFLFEVLKDGRPKLSEREQLIKYFNEKYTTWYSGLPEGRLIGEFVVQILEELGNGDN